MNDEAKIVATNLGKIPLEDYLDICAMQHGFSSYEDMRKDGYCIRLSEDCLKIKKNHIDKI
jgi:hypothetical protein